jgi:hypothetical protein
MKKIGFITLLVAALAIMSCSTVSNIASSNPTATAAGTGAGKALSTLYSQYKSTGKVNMGSASTIGSIVELGTYVAALKNSQGVSGYKAAFATGLVSGSTGLVTSGNSMSTVNSLLGIAGLSGISSTVSSTSATATNVASGLTTLFNTFKR